MWQAISVLQDPIDRGFVEEFVRGTSPESVPDDFIDTLVEESLKVPAHVWRQTLRGLIDADVRASLGTITAPTLLIAAGDDAFVSADQQVLLDAIPLSRLELYDGVGHGVHLARPERVVSDIAGFLSSTSRSRWTTESSAKHPLLPRSGRLDSSRRGCSGGVSRPRTLRRPLPRPRRRVPPAIASTRAGRGTASATSSRG